MTLDIQPIFPSGFPHSASATRIYPLALAPFVPAFAARMDRIVGSATVAISNLVAQKRREGADILSLGLGEPDFGTPEHVREAAKAALDAGHTHYTPGPGIPELREAVARFHRDLNGIPCEASNVLATPTKQAVMMSILALADKGDEVLLPDPAWVSYAPITEWAHATAVPVPLDSSDRFRMTPDAVAEKITSKSRVVLLNSPSNPTGGVNTPEDVRGIVELAEDHDLWIISDEIYQRLQYEGEHASAAAVDGGWERTVTIDGLSKSFAMTGWRMGWAVAPEPVFKQLNKLQSHSVTHCTSFAQYGAVAALNGPQDSVEEMREVFRARRDLMVEGLRALPGVSCEVPAGAFYVFPHFEQAEAAGGDEKFCMDLIERAGVAGTPGSSFGDGGKGHLRFSYAASEDVLRESLRRLGSAL